MRKKKLVADLLCGAGGSSTGCLRAMRELGFDMELVCVNHWPTAIETHSRNHPKARHYCQDISTVRPHIVVPEGYLDLLMASPSCTHHSVARGGKPTSDQQRSDPWHIITWLTELDVLQFIIENVWEFIKWGPVDPATGKPIKEREGEYFNAWLDTIRALRFDLEYRKLNAANYGDPTTRLRFIMKGRKDGKPIGWAPVTHTKTGEGGTKRWKPAREIIDWTIRGKSIYGRKKPLAAKTLARILVGATKFNWPEPFIVTLRNHMAAQGVDLPLPTIVAGGNHIGIAQPVILAPSGAGAPRAADDPLPTITTGGAGANERKGCARPMLVEPFILNRHGDRPNSIANARAHSIDDPAPTADTRGGGFLVEPFVLSRHAGGAPRSIDDPTPTQVAKHSHALISPYYGSGSGKACNSVDQPLPTVTAKPRFGLVLPVTHSGTSNRARDIDSDPLPTLTTAHRGELAFITAQHGERPGQLPRTHDVDLPLPTIAARGHVDLVQATPEYDILFRMLEPHELAAAMGFNSDEAAYEFAGTKTDQVKQIGNAVSVSMMQAEVRASMLDDAAMMDAAE